MILRFVIEPDSLKEVVNRGHWGAFLKSLERFWPSHGLLVFPPNFEDSLRDSGLDMTSLSQWHKFFMRDTYRKTDDSSSLVGLNWDNVQSWDGLTEFKSILDLALLQETRAACFDLLDEDEFCKHDPQGEVPIELTRCKHVLFACRVTQLEELAKKAVPKEETPDEVWNARLRPYANYSTSVAIIDRYAVRGQFQGLKNLLDKLVTEGWQSKSKTQNIDVYSSYEGFAGSGSNSPSGIKADLEKYIEQLRKAVGSKLPKLQITVKLLAEKDMRHDRWIRFDSNIVELSSGLSTFECNRSQPYGFQAKAADPEREKEEARLRSLCKSRPSNNLELLVVYSHPPR